MAWSITGVAEQAAERIRRLVYLDAFIPDDGESCFSIVPAIWESWKGHVEEINGTRVKAPWGREFLSSVWGITDPDELARMEARDAPMPLTTCEEPIRLPEHRAAQLPRSFIRCTESMLVQFAEKAKALGLDYYELAASHASMHSDPTALAEVLIQVIGDAAQDERAIPRGSRGVRGDPERTCRT